MDTAEFREGGHRIVDLLADYLEGIDERPLFPAISPEESERLFVEPVPQDGAALDDLIAILQDRLLPHCTQVNHPGYMGLITPTPLPVGVLGDMIASTLNQNLGLWSVGPSAVAMERQVLRWLCDLIGYDTAAGGNLTSGGMMANFIGLKLARDKVSGDRAQHDGIREQFAAYTSDERHVSVDKAADAVGMGRKGLRIIPSDTEFRIDCDALEEAIARDREDGITPACVIAMAGSTNNGAIDPLARLRAICDREGIWLHADAAYGGGLLLSETHDALLAGLSLADSVTLDPHKWFYAPLDAGAILVKDAARLTASFGMRPAYLSGDKGIAGRYEFYVHGFEQSRRFRGLKVWMGLKRYGTREIGRWVDANIAQAARLHDLCTADPDFEVAVRPQMSAICVRYVGSGLADEDAAAFHTEVARRLEAAGRFWFSTTVLKERPWFRINPVNFRTRSEHMDELYAVLKTECARLAQESAAVT